MQRAINQLAQGGAALEGGDVKAAAGALRCAQPGGRCGRGLLRAHRTSGCCRCRCPLRLPRLLLLVTPSTCPALCLRSGGWVRDFQASATKLSYTAGAKTSGAWSHRLAGPAGEGRRASGSALPALPERLVPVAKPSPDASLHARCLRPCLACSRGGVQRPVGAAGGGGQGLCGGGEEGLREWSLPSPPCRLPVPACACLCLAACLPGTERPLAGCLAQPYKLITAS